MSYNVKIRHHADSGDGVSVEARVEGEPVAHTFPKGMGYFKKRQEGPPEFVHKLVEKYEEKMKRDGSVSKDVLSVEERMVQGQEFENNSYSVGRKTLKKDNKLSERMQVDTTEPEQVRKYLKENMAEGYLSEEEGMNIDAFVNKYKELMEGRDKMQELVREIQEGRVQ